MDSMIIFRVHCGNCTTETSQLYIKCYECHDIKLCLQCFAKGAELKNHLKNHDYQIIDNGTFSLHDQAWSAVEDQLLIDSVEQFGFGNWEDVASNISTKTAKQVEEHYMSVFMDSYLGRMVVPTDIPNRMTDHTPSIYESAAHLPPPNLQVGKAEQLKLAYMPNRDDFEYEFDNDAESLISSIFMNAEDDDLERALKLAKVDMYLTRLQERQRHKDISREYNLVDKFFFKEEEQTSESTRDLADKLRTFSQFMKSDQFKQLTQDIGREKYLKLKIKRLQNYRKNGLTKFEGCDFYESERHKRNKQGKESHFKNPESDKKFSALMSSPGYSLLSCSEKQLCNSLRISPSQYITSKALILKDSAIKQHGLQNKHKLSTYIDKVQRRKISSFLRTKGWLS